MNPYKGRSVHNGQLVEVYRNLNVGGFSIRDAKTKLVLAHCETLILENPKFIVSQSGRQKVLETRSKFVHAVVRGNILLKDIPVKINNLIEVHYNPYQTKTFEVSNSPITESSSRLFAKNDKVYLIEK